jgi:transcriptional regulator with XRE-family HTH domain
LKKVEEMQMVSFEDIFQNSHPGMALHGLRVREGLTQQKMAKKLGVSQGLITMLEQNRRKISAKMARLIALVFDCSPKSFQ